MIFFYFANVYCMFMNSTTRFTNMSKLLYNSMKVKIRWLRIYSRSHSYILQNKMDYAKGKKIKIQYA